MMRLSNMEFHAYHGCLESERTRGNRFRVDFECDYDMSMAAQSDNLQHAVNYSDIYEIIREQMAIPSNLLENVAYRILKAVQSSFPSLEQATVTVSKFNPPLSGPCESSSVTISFRKDSVCRNA